MLGHDGMLKISTSYLSKLDEEIIMKSMYHIILAGGSGSRFWPKSRKNTPKQLLKIIDDKTMIRLTYDRIKKISDENHILVVASRELCKQIHEEIPEIREENYIIEPSGKNTAPAIGLAAIHVFKRNPNAIMGVYPADHIIIGDSKFENVINKAQKKAQQKESLVTIGIKPTHPATGYGYIQYEIHKKSKIDGICKVKQFTEKPDIKTAKEFLKNGKFLWNGGMFVWKAEAILLQIKTYIPRLYQSLNIINKALSTSKYEHQLKKEWDLIYPESIDYGILEKANDVYTIQADFKWNDLGTWRSLFNMINKNNDQNHHDGDVISIQSKNNLIISPNKLTAVVGIEDVSVINLDNATLIVSHEQSELVKDVVDMLKSLNRNDYL